MGATVILYNRQQRLIGKVLTDDHGEFRLLGLLPPAFRRRRRRHVSWQSRRRRTVGRRAHFRRAERHDRFAGGQKRSGKVAVASAAVL
jgi:protocatechuate 3,4-dioxygenase beta subunit